MVLVNHNEYKSYLRSMIKNIIFDFGGVLFNLDFKKTFDAFAALGYNNFDEMFTQYSADALFKQLETGNISINDFYEQLKKFASKPVTNDELEQAWNAMLIGYRKNSLEFLKQIRSKYNLYLLSNTNQVHYNAFSKMLLQETPYQSLEQFFTTAYYSHIIHRRKPNMDIYEFVLKDAGINAAETLFIDDSYTNLPNAEKLGIKTHLLLPHETIEELNYTAY